MLAHGAELRFRTSDVEVFADTVGRLLRPFDITYRAGAYDARLEHGSLGELAFTTLRYGNDVAIDVDCLDRFYVLQVPVQGSLTVTHGTRQRVYGGSDVHLMTPFAPARLQMDRRCRLLVVRIERALLDSHFRTLSGERMESAAGLREHMPLAGERGKSFRRCLDHLCHEAMQPESLLRSAPAARQAEQMWFALLHALYSSAGDDSGDTQCAPYYVKRAEAFIEANLAADVGLVDIVAASGVSVRTLYDGFQRARGVGPIAWLRKLRLDRARADLVQADPSTTRVTDVAIRWGFVHLGRFAAAYRTTFGETPSETLHRWTP